MGVAQENCYDLNMVCTHCRHGVSNVVFGHRIEESLGNGDRRSCCAEDHVTPAGVVLGASSQMVLQPREYDDSYRPLQR